MPVAIAPVAEPANARAGGLFALVSSVHTGMFSDKVGSLFVEVLAGSVVPGDRLEIIRADGTATQVVAERLRQAPGQTVLDLRDPKPAKGDVQGATLARTPGLDAPSLPDGDPVTDRLLVAIRAARAQGFPREWATPIRPFSLVTPDKLAAQFGSLPDEAVVLLIQKRVRDALGHHDNPFAIIGDVQGAAMHLHAVGLHDDGDRVLLTGSAVVQGHQTAHALRVAATAGAMGVLASEKAVEAGLEIGQRLGWAIGIEMGETFAKSFASSIKAGGEVLEDALLAAGRAVAVGRCRKCGQVVQFDYGLSGLTKSRELKCPNDHRKAEEPLLVIPGDAPAALEALRQLKA